MEEFFKTLQFSNMVWQIITPLIFSLADIITGYIQAVINNNVDSKRMREGLLHKVLITIILCLSFVMQFAFNIKSISIGVCIYICVMETTSILENLNKAGIDFKIAKFLKGDEENEIK